MLSMAAKRFSSVRGVTLNRDEWFDPTGSWRPLGLSSVNVIWYGLSEANRAVLYCGDQRRIRLLVLPPDIAEDVALAATFLTCTPGNSLTTMQALATARARFHGPRLNRTVAATWSGGTVPEPVADALPISTWFRRSGVSAGPAADRCIQARPTRSAHGAVPSGHSGVDSVTDDEARLDGSNEVAERCRRVARPVAAAPAKGSLPVGQPPWSTGGAPPAWGTGGAHTTAGAAAVSPTAAASIPLPSPAGEHWLPRRASNVIGAIMMIGHL